VQSGESSFEHTVKPTPEHEPQRFEHYELLTDKDGQPLEYPRVSHSGQAEQLAKAGD
jgi:hypothetical protein